MKKIVLIDTSVLVELLRLPLEDDHHRELEEAFDQMQYQGVEFQIPAAVVMEAGAHVARVNEGNARRKCAQAFSSFLSAARDQDFPFSFSELSWDRDFIGELLDPPEEHQRIPESLGTQNLEMGDLTILAEFRLLRAGMSAKHADLDVWTLDSSLRAAVDEIRGTASDLSLWITI